MAVYDIYEDKVLEVHLLKSGFCWPGLILAWLCTATRGMMGIALMQALFWFLFFFIGLSFWLNLNWLYLIQPLSDFSQLSTWMFKGLAVVFWLLVLLIHLYVGLFCNNWYRNFVDARGWKRVGNVMAMSRKEALNKWQRD